MVAGAAVEDAVARATALPSLRVGLHLVLVRGRPVLPPAEVPDLVDATGAFSNDLARAGVGFFFSPRVRRQLAAEIRAQFERFHATGLPLDHANAHNHMQLHPTVLDLMLRIGADYGLKAVRLPYEPYAASWRAAGDKRWSRFAHGVLLRPLVAVHRRRLARAGVACNDFLFGMSDSGGMTRDRLLGFLAQLPDGVSEIHCHPATGDWPEREPEAHGYLGPEELAALTDPSVKAALSAHGVAATGFAELAGSPRR